MDAIASSADEAIADAHRLAELGVPLFTCRLTPDGEPLPPMGWQKTKPNARAADKWRPGLALCAVTGVKYDVLDIDPRNGGTFAVKRMGAELGDDGPDIYWRVRTPSGGLHLWVAPLGIGSHNGFVGGIDLKGGKPDGEGRGFVFLPPTVRPSRTDGISRNYVASVELAGINGDSPCNALRDYIGARLTESGKSGVGRPEADILAEAARKAEEGDQRTALLRYTHELERRGYSRSDILKLLKTVVDEMPVYDPERPWRERDLRGLLHQPGVVIGDATPGEVEGLKPITAGLVRPVSELEEAIVEWLWPGYLAFRELTIIDGEKAKGKTFVTDDVAARASRGLPMPGQDEAAVGPTNVIIFTDEGHMESVTRPRLRAAGADLGKIFIPAIKVPKRGEKNLDWDLALPDGAAMIGRMIAEAGAGLAIFDPITDFLDESVLTHNDASVRRALRPLAIELAKVGCAGLAIRHMNKQTGMDAKYRGSGSTAFQNRARVHLIVNEVPLSQRLGTTGRFALAMVDSNMAVKNEGALTYDIVDSEVQMDAMGNMIGRVDWHGYADVDILSGEKQRHGPPPSQNREMAVEILSELFTQKETWPMRKVQQELKDADITLSRVTLNKVRDELGIRSIRVYRRGAMGVASWLWTVSKDKLSQLEE